VSSRHKSFFSETNTVSDSVASWEEYTPNKTAPWNLRRVVHLHRRAAFAAPWADLQRDLANGPRDAVDRLLNGHASEASSEDFEKMARTIGNAAMASGSSGRLKAWWLYRMLKSPDPLSERLTLMWHNHFATNNRKVQDLVQMRAQNELFRKHARAPFADLLDSVVKHPAMLVWLDADSNRKGHPNENLARELMELFTLGIGNYSEADVKEAARSLTGWTIVGGKFGFREARHDDGKKQVLDLHGKLTGDDLISLLVENVVTAKRLAWRLCQTFMGEGVVSDQALSELAHGLSAHHLDIDWAVETILRSKLFFSPANLRTRIIGPVEYAVGALRALELCNSPPSTLLLSEWTARMGQDLFYPPNVGGWNEGRAWLGSRTVIARANFASALADGQLWHPVLKPDFEALVGRHGIDLSLKNDVTWLANLLWGEASGSVVEQVIAHSQATKSSSPLSTALVLLMARPEHQLA